ncbi:hypothetical protein BKA64DRAFT_681039, partial [Cadophora sp. MPI-SDFR-AT-0126]
MTWLLPLSVSAFLFSYHQVMTARLNLANLSRRLCCDSGDNAMTMRPGFVAAAGPDNYCLPIIVPPNFDCAGGFGPGFVSLAYSNNTFRNTTI